MFSLFTDVHRIPPSRRIGWHLTIPWSRCIVTQILGFAFENNYGWFISEEKPSQKLALKYEGSP